MTFSDRFLAALGGWQRGWREDKDRRLVLAQELTAAVEAEGLSAKFQSSNAVCYRKRYLVPNNPQNGGDLGPLFLNGSVVEGLASWTTDKKFAQEFKDPLREGTFAAVFAHRPSGGEVLANIPELWSDPVFESAVEAYSKRNGANADALLHFKFRQSEIVMNADLRLDELVALCGKSSPFDVLCELGGLTTDVDRDDYWQRLVKDDKFPEDPTWLTVEQTQDVLQRTKRKFLEKHGCVIEDVMERRSRDSFNGQAS